MHALGPSAPSLHITGLGPSAWLKQVSVSLSQGFGFYKRPEHELLSSGFYRGLYGAINVAYGLSSSNVFFFCASFAKQHKQATKLSTTLISATIVESIKTWLSREQWPNSAISQSNHSPHDVHSVKGCWDIQWLSIIPSQPLGVLSRLGMPFRTSLGYWMLKCEITL